MIVRRTSLTDCVWCKVVGLPDDGSAATETAAGGGEGRAADESLIELVKQSSDEFM